MLTTLTTLRERGIYQLPDDGTTRPESETLVVASNAIQNGGGTLHTLDEWAAWAAADWEFTPDGLLTLQGQPTGYTTGDLEDTGRTAEE